jgi:two-component system, NarL family, response regulator LiaR
MKKIRLLIVDDITAIREGLAAILANYPDMEVIGQAADGIQAMEMINQDKPDVILLDLVMPRQDGLTTIPQIRESAPDARILVFTAHYENDLVYRAIKAGALGYLLKDATRDQLVQSVREVAQGKFSLLQPYIAAKIIQEIDHSSELPLTTDPLTQRELEVVRLVARGLTNQEIAGKLAVQERTIAKNISRILDKLHLANRTRAALYALKEGLVASDSNTTV